MIEANTLTHGGLTSEASARTVPAPAAETAVDRAAEAIWVAGQGARWSSLVVVPAEPGLPVAPLARAVAAVGSAQRGEAVASLDLRGRALADSRGLVEALSDGSRPFSQIAAVDCPLESQTALLLATAAQAAILVLAKERTSLQAARAVIDAVGASRFIGAVLLETVRK